MRAIAILTFCFLPAVAQIPTVHLTNLSRPSSSDFQIGDRFEIRTTAAPDQPVSVRTTRSGRTDWGPVIARTDNTGHWSTSGQFDKSDFGDWSETWTVGGKLATPAIEFDVKAPCLPGGFVRLMRMSLAEELTCDTAEGPQSFFTPSDSDTLRTPDGRLVPGRSRHDQTPELYHMDMLTYSITSRDAEAGRTSLSSSRGKLGDETAALIEKMIGPNALRKQETQNVLAIIRAAFENPETLAPESRQPTRTLALLRHLAETSDDADLRKQITGTIAYVQSR